MRYGTNLSWEEIDGFLSDLFESNFNSNRPSFSKMNTMYWAIAHYNPVVKIRRSLPFSYALLRAWRKQLPPPSRIPVPWLVVVLLSRLAAEEGLYEEAVAFLLLGHSWIRVGHIFTLKKEDVIINLHLFDPDFPPMFIRLRTTKQGRNNMCLF